MKNLLTFSFVLFFSLSTSLLFSQSQTNKISFDISFGYNKALNPYRNNLNSDFSGLKHVELGVRYMFTEKVGLRLNYANDRFKNDADGQFGSNFSRVGVDAVYNAGKAIGLDFATRSTVGLLAHVGVGYTRLKPIYQDNSEQIGALVLGITPQLKLSERVALFGDVSYNANFKQHYRYDGSLISSDYKSTVGSHVTASVGLMFYLGENKYHSDWY